MNKNNNNNQPKVFYNNVKTEHKKNIYINGNLKLLERILINTQKQQHSDYNKKATFSCEFYASLE